MVALHSAAPPCARPRVGPPIRGWSASRSALTALGAAGLSFPFAYGAGGQMTDVLMTYQPAWRLAHGLGLALPPGQAIASETVRTAGGLFSDRMPGLIALAVPSQIAAATPSWWAVRFVTAGLIAVAVWCACQLWGATGCALLIVTPLVSVAGRTLWPETALSAVLLAALLVSRHSRLLPFLMPLAALCVLVRPPAALLLAVVVFDGGLDRRRRLVWLTGGWLVGVAGLLAYDEWLFGQLMPAGAYAPHSQGAGAVVRSMWIGLVSPARGLLFYAPWLAWGLRRRAWSPVVGIGVLYVLASWWDSGAWGGAGFLGVRYPIPLLLLAFPILWADFGSTRWFRVACAWSALWTIAGLLMPIVVAEGRDPWQVPVHPFVLVSALFAVCGVIVVVQLWLSRRPGARTPTFDDRVATWPLGWSETADTARD